MSGDTDASGIGVDAGGGPESGFGGDGSGSGGAGSSGGGGDMSVGGSGGDSSASGDSGISSGGTGGMGTAGSDASAGSGAGTGGSGATGEACSSETQLRCSADGAGARDICQGGTWRAGEACGSNSVCVAADPTHCQPINQLCIGSAGQYICSGADLIGCDAQGIGGTPVTCRSAQLCELGKAVGMCALCLDGEHHCSSTELQVCAQGNMSWSDMTACDTAALCNESAGACTTAACAPGAHCNGDMRQHCNAARTGYDDVMMCGAGLCDQAHDQCDVCVAGAGRCVGNTSYTCASDGQSEIPQTCPLLCAGSGKCVDCTSPSNCGTPSNPCQVATCNAMGTCGMTNAPQNASCATGLCDGQGNCKCRDSTDCHAASLVCISGVCKTNVCGDAVTAGSEECDLGSGNGNTGACTAGCKNARCGDGFTQAGVEQCDDGVASTTGPCPNCKNAVCNDGFIQSGVEECDPRAAGWDLSSCDTSCKRVLYTECMQTSSCTNGYSCNFGGCTPNCTSAGTPCPTLPGWPAAVCGGLGGSCLLKCPNNTCPSGLTCSDLMDGNGPVCHI